MVLGKDLEGGAISGDGFFEQLAAFFSAATASEFVKRAPQIHLGHRPILRQIVFGSDLERRATSGNGFFEQLAAFVSAAARPECSKRVS
jgi:hypothetical protein